MGRVEQPRIGRACRDKEERIVGIRKRERVPLQRLSVEKNRGLPMGVERNEGL